MYRSLSPAFSAVVLLAGLHSGVSQAADSGFSPTLPEATATDLSGPRASIKAGDYKGAIAALNKLAAKDPKNADIHNLLGYSYRKSGNLDKAFESYNLALKLDPNHRGAHEYIGEAFLMANKPEEAEKHLAALAKLCNSKCEEFEDLQKSIATYKAARK
jgi:tetratricopeptide (TPR) repeat protein